MTGREQKMTGGPAFARSLLMAATSAAVMVLVFSAESAAAAPCSASTPKAVSIVPPAGGYIFGRETEVDVTATSAFYPGEWGLVGASAGEALLTATSADPAKPISHPFQRTVEPHVEGYDDPSFARHATITLEPGDGPVALTATWEQYQQGSGPGGTGAAPNCDGTTTVIVTGTNEGKAPSARADSDLETSRDRRLSPRYYTYWQESIVFDVKHARPEGSAAAGPVTVEIEGRGQKRTMSLPDQLDSKWKPRGGPAKGWSLTRDGRFVPSAQFRGRAKFRYEVSFAGKRLAHGDFSVKHESASSSKIFEGQKDAFFNTCIDSNRKLFSQGGRLYCWEYRYPAIASISGVRR